MRAFIGLRALLPLRLSACGVDDIPAYDAQTAADWAQAEGAASEIPVKAWIRGFVRAATFAAFLVCGWSAFAQPDFPPLTGRVVDQAGILLDGTEINLTRTLKRYEEKTTNQIVIVTVESLQGYAIEDFGLELGRHWGIGQAGRDNGVLLIVAPNERRMRIEVGYGLEGDLTDAEAAHIIRTVIRPGFAADDFYRGVTAGVDAIIAAIGAALDVPASPEAQQPSELATHLVPALMLLFLYGSFGGFMYLSYKGHFKSAGGGPYSGYGGLASLGGAGGGFSGGGFGGGGFSGGGGSFGGGGASGGW